MGSETGFTSCGNGTTVASLMLCCTTSEELSLRVSEATSSLGYTTTTIGANVEYKTKYSPYIACHSIASSIKCSPPAARSPNKRPFITQCRQRISLRPSGTIFLGNPTLLLYLDLAEISSQRIRRRRSSVPSRSGSTPPTPPPAITHCIDRTLVGGPPCTLPEHITKSKQRKKHK